MRNKGNSDSPNPDQKTENSVPLEGLTMWEELELLSIWFFLGFFGLIGFIGLFNLIEDRWKWFREWYSRNRANLALLPYLGGSLLLSWR